MECPTSTSRSAAPRLSPAPARERVPAPHRRPQFSVFDFCCLRAPAVLRAQAARLRGGMERPGAAWNAPGRKIRTQAGRTGENHARPARRMPAGLPAAAADRQGERGAIRRGKQSGGRPPPLSSSASIHLRRQACSCCGWLPSRRGSLSVAAVTRSQHRTQP